METKLTQETLDTIEDCGAAEMPLEETLDIAELTLEQWNASPEASRRYKKGQLKTKLSVRQAIVKGARSGNPALLREYQNFAAMNKPAVDLGDLGDLSTLLEETKENTTP